MIDLHHLPGADLHEQNAAIHRRHVFTLIPVLVVLILIVGIPVASYLWLQATQPALLAVGANKALFVLGGSAFFLFGWIFAFVMFMDYWLDVFIVTEKRIIDIDQTGIFSRTVSELRLYRIQDVTAQVKGIWQSMFDYGEVFIQTAGEVERFHFENIPHPNRLAKEILELAEADRKENLAAAVEEISEQKAVEK